MSKLKVDAISHNAATSDAITMASDGTCTAKITSVGGGHLSHRNIIVNGAMMVAQRSTSSTNNGYGSVDRFQCQHSGADENPTHSQHTLTSSDTGPWQEGFRKSFHVQNGNNTNGAGAGDWMRIWHKIEAQDMANSGWNYTSPSSYITLSFWVKVSVAKTYYVQMRTSDGTSKNYYFTMNLSADTWTKVTHSIPGHADISFDNDNGEGIYIAWYGYRGTNNTGSGQNANQWYDFVGATITPDQTPDWWTTNDATFEITGVQLEVGDVATSFEHLRFGEELSRCQRYYYQVGGQTNDGQPDEPYGVLLPMAMNATSTRVKGVLTHPVPMRTGPSVSGGGSGACLCQCGDVSSSTVLVYQAIWTASNTARHTWIDMSPNSGTVGLIGETGIVYANNSTYHFKVSAELT